MNYLPLFLPDFHFLFLHHHHHRHHNFLYIVILPTIITSTFFSYFLNSFLLLNLPYICRSSQRIIIKDKVLASHIKSLSFPLFLLISALLQTPIPSGSSLAFLGQITHVHHGHKFEQADPQNLQTDLINSLMVSVQRNYRNLEY